MRPIPIPTSDIPEGAVRRVITAPDGDLLNEQISPIDSIVQPMAIGEHAIWMYSVKMELEEGELERLNNGGHLWLDFLSHIAPFNARVEDD